MCTQIVRSSRMYKAQMHRTVFAVKLCGLFFGELAEYRMFRQWAFGVESVDGFSKVSQRLLNLKLLVGPKEFFCVGWQLEARLYIFDDRLFH